jgi:hypothetical protein
MDLSQSHFQVRIHLTAALKIEHLSGECYRTRNFISLHDFAAIPLAWSAAAAIVQSCPVGGCRDEKKSRPNPFKSFTLSEPAAYRPVCKLSHPEFKPDFSLAKARTSQYI